MRPILSINELSVRFATGKETVYAVNGFSFQLTRGEILGIIGESGCGKTVTCRAILGLNKGAQTSGVVSLDGVNILGLGEPELREIRGGRISMVFQNPTSSLNPLVKIGTQIAEVIQLHQRLPRGAAKTEAVRLLRNMGIPSPEYKLDEYPHQQSGGTNQRIMIAIALSCNPDILIADEPTASLDVTVQNQILAAFSRLKRDRNIGILFVTHNLGVIYETADRVLIMYKGMLMEEGDTHTIFEDPLHPYTKALLSSIPLYGKEHIILKGEPSSPLEQPSGKCPFASRCQQFIGKICLEKLPPLVGNTRKVRCHLYDSGDSRLRR